MAKLGSTCVTYIRGNVHVIGYRVAAMSVGIVRVVCEHIVTAVRVLKRVTVRQWIEQNVPSDSGNINASPSGQK